MKVLAAVLLILVLPTLCCAGEVKYLAASWYSEKSLKKEGTWKVSGGRMANGKQYDEKKYTCATRCFPLGAIVRISYRRRYIDCLVTDRIGKRFAETRIDLTPTAFSALTNLEQGIIPRVKVERVK